MANYKELNKELVEQVQAMRICINDYKEEITALRLECMQKHESLVHLKKKIKNLALRQCQKYLEFLDPECSILSLLKETDEQRHEIHRTDNRINVNNHQSARLTAECRRSSSLTLTRRSFNTTSPIRSPSCCEVQADDDDEVENDVQPAPAPAPLLVTNAIEEEDEENDSSTSEEASSIMELTSNTLDNTDSDTIHQNETSDDPIENNSNTITTINTNAAVARRSMRTTLRNITNTRHVNASLSNIDKSSLEKGGHDKEDPAIGDVLEKDLLPAKSTNHVTVSRGKCKVMRRSSPQRRATDICNESNMDQSSLKSIQEPRHIVMERQRITELFHSPTQEVSASISEITLSQFDEATSSTPRLKQKTPALVSSPHHSSRPKRSCKPKSLAEPALNTKMRNDTGEKSIESFGKKERKRGTSKKK